MHTRNDTDRSPPKARTIECRIQGLRREADGGPRRRPLDSAGLERVTNYDRWLPGTARRSPGAGLVALAVNWGPPVRRPMFGRTRDLNAMARLWEVSERETGITVDVKPA